MEDRRLIDIVIDVFHVGATIMTILLTIFLAGVLVIRVMEIVR